MATPTIIDAARDPRLFGPWFKDTGTWAAWLVAIKALFALPLDGDELAVFTQCTGRTVPPASPAAEGWFIVGRRGGKSFTTALIGVFLACFRDYTPYLAPGERATVMLLACDRKQARVIFRYVKALLDGVAMLRRMVVAETTESITLNNHVVIEIHSASIRSVRGYTCAAVLCDEISFWRDDTSANPDREIINALRPGMATIPGAMLIGISSPYSRRGVLYEAFRDYHSQEDTEVFVWRAATQVMNPTVPQRIIKRAYTEDPLAAASEYGAEFRSDLATFLDGAWLDDAVMAGVHELPPRPDVQYHAFIDPSGGGADSFTCAIAHKENSTVVLDACRGRHGSPEGAVTEYAELLKVYGVTAATGDRYASQWVVDAFRRAGITYRHSEKSKSDIYLEALPLFSTGAVRLLDNVRLLAELRQLERRTSSSGKDSIDHPPRAHDDYANATAGALWLCSERVPTNFIEFIDVSDEPHSLFFSTGARRLYG